MTPGKEASTGIVNKPVPHTGSSTPLLDLVPDTVSEQIHVPLKCMGIKSQEESLVICINNTGVSNTTLCQPCQSRWAERVPVSAVSLVGVPAQTPQTQLKKNQQVTKTMSQDMGVSVAPTTHRENQRAVLDSVCSQQERTKHDGHSSTTTYHHACTPTAYNHTVSQHTDTNRRRTRPRQTIFRLTDFNQLRNSTESETCKYVNIEQPDVKNYNEGNGARHCTDSDIAHTSEASHTHLDCDNPLQREGGTGSNLSNWVRAVKPEAKGSASLDAAESWPPLLACSKKRAHRKHEDVRFGNMESHSITATPQSEPTMPLDEQSWPFLEKSCKPHVQNDDFCSDNKWRTPLIKSNMYQHKETTHTMQNQRQQVKQFTARGGFHATENIHIPPCLLMLNKDFIVTSPLKENLLLTLVLMGKRTDVETSASFHGKTTEGDTKRQVLVGQFKAFSSFLNFMLGRDATRVRTESNAGGTSTVSESLSVEYFVRRFQAKDIVTEMEVEYQSFNWKKVDYICTLYGQRVGVSVTRAMSFPDPKDFSAQMAYRLLCKKLFGLVVARHGVSKRHSFSQCILHIWCETQQTASIIQKEYDGVSQELDIANDVVMVLTVADGHHARPIFYESLLKSG